MESAGGVSSWPAAVTLEDFAVFNARRRFSWFGFVFTTQSGNIWGQDLIVDGNAVLDEQ